MQADSFIEDDIGLKADEHEASPEGSEAEEVEPAAVEREANGRASRVRNWCFTINTITKTKPFYVPGASDVQQLCGLAEGANGQVSYIAFQLERGSKDLRLHWQGYLELRDQLTLFDVQRLHPLFERAHFERRRGTQQQAVDYVLQQGVHAGKAGGRAVDIPWSGPHQAGSLKRQGTRADLQAMVDLLRSGKSLRDLSNADAPVYIMHHRGIAAWYSLNAEPRSWPPVVAVFHGASGVGKTRLCFEFGHTPLDVYKWEPGQGAWFDGYIGQPIVILDEMGGDMPMKLGQLLNLLDRYPMLVQVKGATQSWRPRLIFLCSNYHPNDWFTSIGGPNPQVQAFFRRVTYVSPSLEVAAAGDGEYPMQRVCDEFFATEFRGVSPTVTVAEQLRKYDIKCPAVESLKY